jgi:hypothetical protein
MPHFLWYCHRAKRRALNVNEIVTGPKRSGGTCWFFSVHPIWPIIKVTTLHLSSRAQGPAVRPGSRTKISVPLVLYRIVILRSCDFIDLSREVIEF